MEWGSTEPGTVADLSRCKNCERCTTRPLKHSFGAPLDRSKNRAWMGSSEGSWLVVPTSKASASEALADSAFCSGDCVYSYLFSRDLLASARPDTALHFFRRHDSHPSTVRTSGAAHETYSSHSSARAGSSTRGGMSACGSPRDSRGLGAPPYVSSLMSSCENVGTWSPEDADPTLPSDRILTHSTSASGALAVGGGGGMGGGGSSAAGAGNLFNLHTKRASPAASRPACSGFGGLGSGMGAGGIGEGQIDFRSGSGACTFSVGVGGPINGGMPLSTLHEGYATRDDEPGLEATRLDATRFEAPGLRLDASGAFFSQVGGVGSTLYVGVGATTAGTAPRVSGRTLSLQANRALEGMHGY